MSDTSSYYGGNFCQIILKSNHRGLKYVLDTKSGIGWTDIGDEEHDSI